MRSATILSYFVSVGIFYMIKSFKIKKEDWAWWFTMVGMVP
jgi:hypothetical protein